MADVARAAGVSHQTVSRVLNGSASVRPETRERVIRAVRELDYRRNSMARALVTGRSRTLGVVSFDTTLYGPASTLFGIERAAHAEGYFVSIASVTSLDRPSVLAAVEQLRDQGVDGVLLITPQETAVEALLHLPHDMPVVAVEAGPDEAVPVVAVDQVAGAVLATRHLLELGHRTVWHVAGPSDWLEARQRTDGWLTALEDAGADVPPLLAGDWSAQSGYELGRRLATVRDVTAIFAANDQMALGVLAACRQAGLSVPGDITVVGFGNTSAAEHAVPALSTVSMPRHQLGVEAMQAVLDALAVESTQVRPRRLPFYLVIRESSAPPGDPASGRGMDRVRK
jgi:DNA-binding LacI/PurR family transcriptional regulator